MYKTNTLLNMTKKTSSQDWHKADILAAVKKTGSSVTKLSRINNLSDSVVAQALLKPYPKCERIIANHLGVAVQTIWPSRYHPDGTPKSGRGERGIGRHFSKLSANSTKSIHAKNNIKSNKQLKHHFSTTSKARNVNDETPIKQAVAA